MSLCGERMKEFWVASDSRGLNDLTLTHSYPTKIMRNILDQLRSKRAWSVFDLNVSYFQVELPSTSNECMAIRTVLELFQHKRLLSELKSSPGVHQRSVNNILRDHRGVCVFAFFSDTRFWLTTEEDRLAFWASILDTMLADERLQIFRCRLGGRSSEVFCRVGYADFKIELSTKSQKARSWLGTVIWFSHKRFWCSLWVSTRPTRPYENMRRDCADTERLFKKPAKLRINRVTAELHYNFSFILKLRKNAWLLRALLLFNWATKEDQNYKTLVLLSKKVWM